jgi:hypothetical protein
LPKIISGECASPAFNTTKRQASGLSDGGSLGLQDGGHRHRDHHGGMGIAPNPAASCNKILVV